jgi:hypothetical protein
LVICFPCECESFSFRFRFFLIGTDCHYTWFSSRCKNYRTFLPSFIRILRCPALPGGKSSTKQPGQGCTGADRLPSRQGPGNGLTGTTRHDRHDQARPGNGGIIICVVWRLPHRHTLFTSQPGSAGDYTDFTILIVWRRFLTQTT